MNPEKIDHMLLRHAKKTFNLGLGGGLLAVKLENGILEYFVIPSWEIKIEGPNERYQAKIEAFEESKKLSPVQAASHNETVPS